MPTSDKEEMQMIKDWRKRYGTVILIAILVFALANFSWRYWQKYKQVQMERASTNYTQMLMALDKQKNDEIKLYATNIIKNYPRSSYASLAALMLAKIAVTSNDFKLAEQQLQFVIKKSPSDALRQLARIRLARIFLATKKPQEALNLLKTVDDDAYNDEVNEVSGDALLSLGKVSEANQAYKKVKDAKSSLLKLKMQQF